MKHMALCMTGGLVAAMGLCAPAAAQEEPEWSGQVTAYVWATGVGGSITPFGGAPTVETDKSFSDLLEDLDAAFFLSGYVRRDRFVLLGDLSHSSSSKEGRVPALGIPAEGRLRQTSLTLAGGYRVVDDPKATVDLLAGGRVWWLRGSVRVPLAGVDRSPNLSFVDPIVGARANIGLAPRWSVIAYGDVGGFGAGSKSTSQLLGTINYQASENLYFSAGYRHLHVDHRSGATRVDVVMSGPLLGATWRF
ncbi:MAG: hypothetical protein AB7E05_05470 [Sphingobium sp.]